MREFSCFEEYSVIKLLLPFSWVTVLLRGDMVTIIPGPTYFSWTHQDSFQKQAFHRHPTEHVINKQFFSLSPGVCKPLINVKDLKMLNSGWRGLARSIII